MDTINLNADKNTIFETIKNYLIANGLKIQNMDNERPWGGFFVIDDSSLQTFLELFFEDVEFEESDDNFTLSPKILLVQPGKRLSWQYHFRRSEYWTVVKGEVGIVLSDDDQEKPLEIYKTGDMINIKKGQRHRLVGLEEWGVVAEIWKHIDPSNPSDEEDIVRLEDDFGR